MSSFTRPLEIEYLPDSDLYRTLESFKFYYDDSLSGDFVIVPKGLLSNGASIPLAIRKLFGWEPMDPRWVQAAFLHDALVGEFGVRVPIYSNKVEPRWPDWNESTKWFDKALAVRMKGQSLSFKRRSFVFCVKQWGRFRKEPPICQRLLPHVHE